MYRNSQFMILPPFSTTWEVARKVWKFLTKCSALSCYHLTTDKNYKDQTSIHEFHKLTSRKLIKLMYVWGISAYFKFLRAWNFILIFHVRYEFYRHSLSVGYKTEFAFDHLPDVDSPDGGAVWSTNHLTGYGLKSHFSLKLFFSCIIAKVTHFHAMTSWITYK